jgi:hypothetical protein
MAYKQSPGRMNMPKTGRGLSPNLLEDPSPKKNTDGIFGGDTILGDENKDGNMVTRGLKKVQDSLKKLDKNLDTSRSKTRPITKNGKLNYDPNRM